MRHFRANGDYEVLATASNGGCDSETKAVPATTYRGPREWVAQRRRPAGAYRRQPARHGGTFSMHAILGQSEDATLCRTTTWPTFGMRLTSARQRSHGLRTLRSAVDSRGQTRESSHGYTVLPSLITCQRRYRHRSKTDCRYGGLFTRRRTAGSGEAA